MATSVSASLEYLNALVMTPRQAIEALDRASGSVQMLALFKHYFPKEFSRFKSLTTTEAHRATQTFVELLNAKMFPMDDMMLEEELSEAGRPLVVLVR